MFFLSFLTECLHRTKTRCAPRSKSHSFLFLIAEFENDGDPDVAETNGSEFTSLGAIQTGRFVGAGTQQGGSMLHKASKAEQKTRSEWFVQAR